MTNQTIDGAPRELLEWALMLACYLQADARKRQLSALLEAPPIKTVRMNSDGSMTITPKPCSDVDVPLKPAAWSVRHVSGKYGFVTLDRDEAVKWASTRSGVSIHALGPINQGTPLDGASEHSLQWCVEGSTIHMKGVRKVRPTERMQTGLSLPPGFPIAWMTRCIKGERLGAVEQAEGPDAISNTEYWSPAFPVYAKQPAPDIKLHVNVSNVKVTLNADGSYSIDPGEQPAPVAIHVHDGGNNQKGDGPTITDGVAHGYYSSGDAGGSVFEQWQTAAPLNYGLLNPIQRLAVCRGEQVEVVLPNRDRITLSAPLNIPSGYTLDGNCEYELQIWRACIDEVARLNSK